MGQMLVLTTSVYVKLQNVSTSHQWQQSVLRRDPRAHAHTRSLVIVLQSLF